MKGKEGREEAGILSALAPWIDSSRISVIPGRLIGTSPAQKVGYMSTSPCLLLLVTLMGTSVCTSEGAEGSHTLC